MSPRQFFLGDVVRLRKAHPCGSCEWEVLRTGMDFRIRCLGCGRVVMLPRVRFEREVKQLVRRQISAEEGTDPSARSMGGPGMMAGPGTNDRLDQGKGR